MRVEHLGDGEPEVAIVGGIHGDEPCGPAVIEGLLAARPAVERPVALVVANEAALDAKTRYVDEDLNRAFPGDPTADTHERRLAARLTDLLSGCETLSLHSTQSYDETFALVNTPGEFEHEVTPRLSVNHIVDATALDRGHLFDSVSSAVEVECGYQGSEQASANGLQIAREFLRAVGALSDARQKPRSDTPVFRLTRRIPKERDGTHYEVSATNFEYVAPGEEFAAVDGQQLVAEDGFVPVLLSPYGYEEQFGYRADRLGPVGEVF